MHDSMTIMHSKAGNKSCSLRSCCMQPALSSAFYLKSVHVISAWRELIQPKSLHLICVKTMQY